jgi:hypothetical protein
MTRRPDPMGMGEGFFWWGVVTLIITLIVSILPDSLAWLFQVSGPWFG